MQNTITPPLLITSSIIAHDKSGKLINSESRLHHLLEGISKWLEINPCLDIVVCDGSNFDLSVILLNKFPQAKIEFLRLQNDSVLIETLGKGFGEGKIIEYSLQHSSKLKNAKFFVKCTGKLWVDNYADLLSEWNGDFLANAHFTNVFSLRKVKLSYIDTRFFMSTLEFYDKVIKPAYQKVDLRTNKGIEDTLLIELRKNNICNFIFQTPPAIKGMSGGSSEYYKFNFRKVLKIKLRNYILSRLPSTKNIFRNNNFLSKVNDSRQQG